MEYFIKKGKQRFGPFTLEQLKEQDLTPGSLIWFEGQPRWQKLKDIPELTPVYNSLPTENRKTKTILLVAGGVLLLAVLFYCFQFYLPNTNRQKPITTEDLYKKYSKSVALIKHSFLYKITLGQTTFYFRDYDKETGRLVDASRNYDSIKAHANTIWGTGFFINNMGQLLTCRHVVDIMPPEEDQIKVLNFLKTQAIADLNRLEASKQQLETDIETISNFLNNYSHLLSSYVVDQKMAQRNLATEMLNDTNDKIMVATSVANSIFDSKNFVSKSSLQFGIFLNDAVSENFNDYIKCESVKVSDDPNTDLALIQTKSKQLPDKDIVPLNLDRIRLPDTMTVRLSEPVRMIGYNYGINMANTSSGIKSQITEGAISQNSDAYKLLYTIPALPGSSGGPVFDQYGNVISVNFAGTRGTQSFNYGIQPKSIKKFLNY